ncbi:MAG: histidine kinase, partial [Frankiales bacterium]|nr:histidine kinase [Frankiales bacterium]
TVPPDVSEHLLSVLSEALSNVAKHSRANRASVEVEASGEVVVRVVDDGVGIDAQGRRSGLKNMADRAELLGGSFEVNPGPAGGTELVWRVPLRA